MANINLLPWREKKREQAKRDFFSYFAAAAVLAGILLAAGHFYVQNEIDNQTARNNYLTEQIALLDAKIAEIRDLQEKKRELTERMTVIQDLQGRRPVIVRLFDELVRTLPEGVYYDSITRTGDIITLQGVADSNNRVSTLMRYLDDSEWFADPALRDITGQTFQLNVRVTTAGDDPAAAEATTP